MKKVIKFYAPTNIKTKDAQMWHLSAEVKGYCTTAG
jgi:hypothetical protein